MDEETEAIFISYKFLALLEHPGQKHIIFIGVFIPALMYNKIIFAAWACKNKKYGSYQAWYTPLSKIFRTVISFDPQETIYRYGRDEMNARFLELVEKEKPDYIFFWLIYDEFTIDALLKIKRISPKTKMINLFGDDASLFYNFSRFYPFEYTSMDSGISNSGPKISGSMIKNNHRLVLQGI